MELTLRRAVAAAGAAGLLAQVVLLRGLLAASHGNELVLGFALAVWLCLTGLGSVLGARLAGSMAAARGRLASVLAGAPVFLVLALWLTGAVGGPAVESEPSLPWLLARSCLALAPAALLGGLAYAFAAAGLPERTHASVLYVGETLGAALAGVVFHFALGERVPSAWIIWLAGTVAALAGAALGWPQRRAATLAVATILAALAVTPAVGRAVIAARFSGARVLAIQPSRYGQLAVVERGSQRVFFHDGVLLFTSEDRAAAEETTHLPLLLHPSPRRILMAGGGLSGGLALALEHRPDVIDYTEMDPAIVALARQYADPETRAALVDARVQVATVDTRRLLRERRGRYDVIILNLPVPQNALMARTSTEECFVEARAALAPGGILAVVTPGSDTYLDPAGRQRHASILAGLGRVFPVVGVAPGSQTIMWASSAPVDARSQVLALRLDERGLRPLQIGKAWLFDRLLPLHAEAYRRSLAPIAAFENRDFRPVVYLFGLLETLERVSPRLARTVLGWLHASSARWLAGGGLALLLALGLLARRGDWGPSLAAATAGAAGMALEMVLLLGFQALAGHLYHALGVVLAGFMGGMAWGAAWVVRHQGRRLALAVTLAVLATLSLVVPGLLMVAHRLPAASLIIVLLGGLLAGAGTGLVYPLAVAAVASPRAAAVVYAWDLLGAAVAALLVTLVAVPLAGLVAVALGSAALCASAALGNLRR
jgi:spermidine synthase